ncbi:hypothetical protein NEPAR06_2029 [Nematocida parisii]|nr:hypothetical protein NEPAR03_2332 [Nematocida parisii]KAI5131512.1 hypothetical protein NEPAR08_2487 [Nematocida parisii]KAI5146263.1 hypothetical protein NEPAR07_2236 [Nematocida parisii]KAI5155757.1 hypothetical protein NEPAR06_2029 [Nematocida parisii]
MKIKLLLLLISIITVNTTQLLSPEEIELLNNEIVKKYLTKWILINTHSLLNFDMAYLLYESGGIYNKRNYAEEIEIKSTVQTYKDSSNNALYQRYPYKDVYYDYFDRENKGEERFKYIKEYHNTLINMFTYTDKFNTPLSDGLTDGLTIFLKHQDILPYVHKVLASLFLISEGLNISLFVQKINDKDFLILKKFNSTEKHFMIDLHLKFIKNNEEITVKQEKTKNIINFFINNRNNPIIEKYNYTEPETYENFYTAKFLYNPKILIYSYIYEHITKKEEMLGFIRTVYDLLYECMNTPIYTTKNTKKTDISILSNTKKFANSLYKKYFIEVLPSNRIFRYSPVNELVKYKNRTISNNLPIILHNPNVTLNREYIQPTGGIWLLKLIKCITYNPITHKYTTDHLPNANFKLINFIKKVKNYFPTDLSTEIGKTWNSSFYGIINENSALFNTQGIISTLEVISKLTSNHTRNKHFIMFKENIRKYGNTGMLYKEIELYTKEFLKPLFKSYYLFPNTENKNTKDLDIKIFIENFSILNIPKNKTYDVFGKIFIRFITHEQEEGIILDINESGIDFYTEKRKIHQLPDTAEHWLRYKVDYVKKRNKNFYGFLFLNFLKMQLRLLNKENTGNINYLIETVNLIINNDKNKVDRLFLGGRIENIFYKEDILVCYLLHIVYLKKSKLSTQFITNILGSEELSDHCVQSILLPIVIYTGIYSECKKLLHLDLLHNYLNIPIHITQLLKILEYLISINSPEILTQWFKSFIGLDWPNTYSVYELLKYAPIKIKLGVLDCISNNGNTVDYIKKLVKIVKKTKNIRYNGNCHIRKSNEIFLIFLGISCHNKTKYTNIIKYCYDSIVYNNSITLIYTGDTSPVYIRTVYQVLVQEKMRLCVKSSGIRKYKAVLYSYRIYLDK